MPKYYCFIYYCTYFSPPSAQTVTVFSHIRVHMYTHTCEPTQASLPVLFLCWGNWAHKRWKGLFKRNCSVMKPHYCIPWCNACGSSCSSLLNPVCADFSLSLSLTHTLRPTHTDNALFSSMGCYCKCLTCVIMVFIDVVTHTHCKNLLFCFPEENSEQSYNKIHSIFFKALKITQ